jgi:hypothetical protein
VTTKADFTPEEWSLLLQAPLAASLYITLAAPSFFGAFGEVMSVTRQLVKNAQTPVDNELFGAMLAEFKDMEGARAAQPQMETRDPVGAKAELREQLVRTEALLRAKATAEEAADLRVRLMNFAHRTAEASKEGGFLGIGGVRVSPEEQEALNDLASIFEVKLASGPETPAA